MRVLHASDLLPSKWLILCYVNLTLIFVKANSRSHKQKMFAGSEVIRRITVQTAHPFRDWETAMNRLAGVNAGVALASIHSSFFK